MVAFANYKNNKGFILDEEKIRKIHEILVKRGQAVNPSCKPIYEVTRSDSLAYKTDSIQEFLQEENARFNSIESISIEMIHGEEFSFSLIFNSDGTEMKARGEDHDFVFLISSDLKQYLQSEVDICGTSRIQNLLTWQSFYVAWAFVWLGWTMFVLPIEQFSRDKYSRQHDQRVAQWEADRKEKLDEELLRVQVLARQAIEQEDVSTKINFLIQRHVEMLESNQADEPEYPDYDPPSLLLSNPLFPIGFTAVLALMLSAAKISLSRLYGRNIFLIGKEIARYSKKAELRDKIVWGIVIAFFVGILSSVAMLFLTTGFNPSQEEENSQSTPEF